MTKGEAKQVAALIGILEYEIDVRRRFGPYPSERLDNIREGLYSLVAALEEKPLAVGLITPTNLKRYQEGELTILCVYSEAAQDDELPVTITPRKVESHEH